MALNRFDQKRIIRNPITGEEINYTKGQTPRFQFQPKMEKISDNPIEALVQKAMPLSTDQANKKDVENSTNKSVVANASSVPLLDFHDLYSEDRKQSGTDLIKNMDEFLSGKSHGLNLSFMDKETKQLKSYAFQAEKTFLQDQSPILSYRNQLTKIPSHLDAPRKDGNGELNDLQVFMFFF